MTSKRLLEDPETATAKRVKTTQELKQNQKHTFIYTAIIYIKDPLILPDKSHLKKYVHKVSESKFLLSEAMDAVLALTKSEFEDNLNPFVKESVLLESSKPAAGHSQVSASSSSRMQYIIQAWQLPTEESLIDTKNAISGKAAEDVAKLVSNPESTYAETCVLGSRVHYFFIVKVQNKEPSAPTPVLTPNFLLEHELKVFRQTLGIILIKEEGKLVLKSELDSELEPKRPPSRQRIDSNRHPLQNDIVQGSEHPISDGRFTHEARNTQAPPIELYEDLFVEFRSKREELEGKYDDSDMEMGEDQEDEEDEEAEGNAEDIDNPFEGIEWQCRSWVFELMCQLAVIGTLGQAEERRMNTIKRYLEKLLGCQLEHFIFAKNEPHLAHIHFDVGGVSVIVELAGSSSDPMTQGGFSFVDSCQKNWKTSVVQCTRSPTFLLAIHGSYMSVAGAVLTSRPIVQRLTSYCCSAYAAYPTDDDVIRHLCCTLGALKHCLHKLRMVYDSLPKSPSHSTIRFCDPTLVRVNNLETDAHPRFFPWPTSFIYRYRPTTPSVTVIIPRDNDEDMEDVDEELEENTRIAFRYECPLTTSSSCVTFLVAVVKPPDGVDDPHPLRDLGYRAIPFANSQQLDEFGLAPGTRLVIKFVRRYGVEAQQFLVGVDRAPKLYSYDRFETVGGYRGLKMVVMEYLAGPTLDTLVDGDLGELQKDAKRLHLLLRYGGFLHGDPRACHFIMSDGVMKLLDFGLAARFAFVKEWTQGKNEYWAIDEYVSPQPTYPPWFDKMWLRVANADRDGIMTEAGQDRMLTFTLQDLQRRFEVLNTGNG